MNEITPSRPNLQVDLDNLTQEINSLEESLVQLSKILEPLYIKWPEELVKDGELVAPVLQRAVMGTKVKELQERIRVTIVTVDKLYSALEL